MGLSLDDFCRCTPSEFRSIYDAWMERQEGLAHQRWEIARFVAVSALQPYSKKTLKPTDVCKFPWEEDKAAVPRGTSSYERMKMLDEMIRKRKG